MIRKWKSPMVSPPLPVLYEDNHLLAVAKPAMLPTMGVAEGAPSLLALARQYIKEKYDKPAGVYLGVVSRLDAPVTGVVLLARTSKAARRLNGQFRERRVEKTYWAVASGQIDPPSGGCIDWLRKDERHRRVHVVGKEEQGAREARLSYRVIRRLDVGQLVEIFLETGRKHQIRVQLARRGCPILGDRKYGSRQPFPVGIALHSRQLVLEHPTRGTRLKLVAPVPQVWRRFGIS